MILENSYFEVRANRNFSKIVTIPTSKSFANRALILAAIKKEEVVLNNIPESSDVINMISALRRIGLIIEEKDNSLIIHNSFPECEIETDEIIELETGDGGTTNRFLIPLLALGRNSYSLKPSHKMIDRPMEELDSTLKEMGVAIFRDEKTWFALQGPLKITKAVVEVDCAISTQFATGLALVLDQFHVEVEPLNLNTSRPYWEMTLDLIARFRDENIFDIPVDFSSLSYPLALAVHGGEVLVKNCFGIDRFQADSIFIKLLENIGIEFSFSKLGLHQAPAKELRAFNFDAKDCPDLIPTLCFLASYIVGKTSTIKSVEVLKYKECDRLNEMMRMLECFQVEHSYDQNTDSLIIKGREPLTEFITYDPPVDHRMAMVSYLFLRMNGGGRLSNRRSVVKSFSNFFHEMDL